MCFETPYIKGTQLPFYYIRVTRTTLDNDIMVVERDMPEVMVDFD